MISLVSQLTQYNELYSAVKYKIQRHSLNEGRQKGYTNKVLSFKIIFEEFKKKKEMKRETRNVFI